MFNVLIALLFVTPTGETDTTYLVSRDQWATKESCEVALAIKSQATAAYVAGVTREGNPVYSYEAMCTTYKTFKQPLEEAYARMIENYENNKE